MAEYSVVLFHSSSHALRAEKILKESGLRIKMIPTPRELSSDCGLALRLDHADGARATAILAENHVPTNGTRSMW
jgi:hypothetical protein